jgi:hypothetical protein
MDDYLSVSYAALRVEPSFMPRQVFSSRRSVTCLSPRLLTAHFATVVLYTSLPPLFRHCVGGGSLATFTQEEVTTRILRHLKLASVPSPIAPARLCQEIFAFDKAVTSMRPQAECAPWRCLSARFACHSPSSWLRPAVVVKPLAAGTLQTAILAAPDGPVLGAHCLATPAGEA